MPRRIEGGGGGTGGGRGGMGTGGSRGLSPREQRDADRARGGNLGEGHARAEDVIGGAVEEAIRRPPEGLRRPEQS